MLKFRVATLESQIDDLQTEASRLIRSLDTQKELAAIDKKDMSKKVEDLLKERDAKVKEVDGLKEKLKQYSDYDEVKRELEIMKVCSELFLSQRLGLITICMTIVRRIRRNEPRRSSRRRRWWRRGFRIKDAWSKCRQS